jgi:hypothetical protein
MDDHDDLRPEPQAFGGCGGAGNVYPNAKDPLPEPPPLHPLDPEPEAPEAYDSQEPTTALTRYVDRAMFEAETVPEDARERPRVHLLSATPDPLGAVAAFSMMYEGRPIDLHFMVEGLTRATWDQMRTQRTAVYAGESLRFAVKEDLKQAVRPGPMVTTDAQKATWDEAIDGIAVAYQYLISNGVPAEDARGLLPMNVLTRGHWKTNLRNLEAEIGKRLCTQAQFEWRVIHADLRAAIRNHQTLCDIRSYGSEREVTDFEDASWQWQYIAESPMFVPICFQKGACMFKASMDRGCTIRERVDRGAFNEIRPEEWLADPTAAWVR